MNETENSPVVIIRDALRREIEKRTEGVVTVMYDDRDIPSYMLRIPRFNVETIDSSLGRGVHPAFIVGEREVEEIFIGLVPATRIGGLAYSLPGYGRISNITFDEAREMCVKKGKGWHLLTNWEYSALFAFLMKAHRTHCAHFQKLYWDWTDGLKLVDGKFYFPKTNDFEKPEAEWDFQGVAFDDIDGRPVLSAEVTHYTEKNIGSKLGTYSYIDEIGKLEKSDSYNALPIEVRTLFARLFIDPVATPIFAYNSVDSNELHVRNYGERVALRGNWGNGPFTGLAALSLGAARSDAGECGVCRPAFINLKD
jgi:hypothetical protein